MAKRKQSELIKSFFQRTTIKLDYEAAALVLNPIKGRMVPMVVLLREDEAGNSYMAAAELTYRTFDELQMAIDRIESKIASDMADGAPDSESDEFEN